MPEITKGQGKAELYLRDDLLQAWQGEEPFALVRNLQGQVFRALEHRRTLRFQLEEKSYFVKFHEGSSWGEVFKNLLQLRLPVVSAKNEWRAVNKLHALGIATLTIAGYGNKGLIPTGKESFLISDDLGDLPNLEDFCGSWKDNPPDFSFKKKLIETLAAIARQMHSHGLCHRDFYICHFLVKSAAPLQMILIDLHRALVKKRLARRWIIKDVGSLYFSVLDLPLTSRDLWRFVKAYSGKELRPCLEEDRRFWQAVERRAWKIKGR